MKSENLFQSGCLALLFLAATSEAQSQGWPGAAADVTLQSQWATYVGGASAQGEAWRAATTDAAGNTYLLAQTEAPGLPQAINARMPVGTAWALFLSKVTPSGQIAWSRWIGDAGTYAAGVACDAAGNVFVGANTGNPAFVDGLTAGVGPFVMKLNAMTGGLQWSQSVSESSWPAWEGGEVALTVDAAGQVYVASYE